MYYELYVDVFFMVNFTMDAILLILLKKLLACPAGYGRVFAGAATGAAMTCIAIVIFRKTPVLRFVVFHGVINVVMMKAGLGIKWGRELFRGWVLLYIESFLLGGVFQFVQQYIRRGSMFFLLAVISYYLVSVIWKIILFFSEKGNRYCEVEVFFGEKNDRRFRYISYHSIGKKEGVMPAFRLDKMQIIRDGNKINVEHPLVAVSEEELGSENYQMIINPDILTGGKKNGDKSGSSTSV